jgi:polar amino acid transport system substrate-binding protein
VQREDRCGRHRCRVGTDEYVEDGGEIVGFDIDLFKAIALEAGLHVTFVNQEWDALIPGLKGGRYDAVISAMTITEDRRKAVDFSDGYFDAGQIITVKQGTEGIAKPADLKGKTIAVQMNTTGHFQAQKIDGATIKTFDSTELAFKELAAGRADAVINDEPPTRIYLKDHPDLQMVGEVFTDEQYGIAVTKGNADLLARINSGLQKVRASGEYDTLRAKWVTGEKQK